MSIDSAQIESGLEALSGIDFASALAAFRSGNLKGEITTVEDVASVVAVFIPDAAYVRDAFVFLGILVTAQDEGLIRPAVPEDPSMSRVERPTGGR